MNRRSKIFLLVVLVSTSLLTAQTPGVVKDSQTALSAKATQTWDADSIVWQRQDSDGTKWAVLEGDKDAPGKMFTYAFFIPAGYWEHHWHTQDARVAVIKGALRVAEGDKLDKAGAKSYPVGSYLYVPANAPHTMGAEVDTIIIGTAQGPWKTHHHEDHDQQHGGHKP